MSTSDAPRCKNLVLDAGPLLSLSPLRGLAETYLTVPQVLAELKDKRARDHFEQLGLLSGVNVKVQSPDAASLAHVIQWAKKTGDYSVLSHPDICVLALTYALSEEAKKAKVAKKDASEPAPESTVDAPATEEISSILEDLPIEDQPETPEDAEVEPLVVAGGSSVEESTDEAQDEAGAESLEPLDVQLQPVEEVASISHPIQPPASQEPLAPVFEDPSDSDDGEGEWITPSNVGLHKSRALDLLPDAGAKGKRKVEEVIDAGCMTADFAMQNVLLQMGLNLVGVEGKRIEKVKSWVLRCHACFKICKDNSKKFCPSCGNPTLLRASVTVSAPGASADAPVMQVHLKPKFQYRIRGTKYSIPTPKAGSAKTGAGDNLILREDQQEYMRAKKQADGKREREEAKMLKGILSRGVEGATGVGSWMDPDWIPEMVTVGSGGKGRTIKSGGMDGDLPQIGYGKKNPNATRKKRK
ncbi:Nin one binding Zn-ribbon like-domain-containing protein [Lyophyllum atratum]|nr:Nin one binding Zn-ribbon like-domain-containing protein [Lyophyllum atratum]